MRRDVLAGLTANPKWLPPKWFYDARGSELFEQITVLPEYYPTRAEQEVLDVRSPEVAAMSRAETLVELGSGSSRKTRALLSALRAEVTLHRYVAVDVSESALRAAGAALLRDHPDLVVEAVVADFEDQLDVLPRSRPRLVALLGGTIGNLEPDARARFLVAVRGLLGDDGAFLLGTDLVKTPDALVPAYDDASGVTAEFNRNVLQVLNRELGATFDVEAFDHVAVWDDEAEWVEMRLRATRAMTVDLPRVELRVDLAEGEEIRTEVSAKFRPEGVAGELAGAGMEPLGQWTDAAGRYAVTLAGPAR